MKKDLRKESPRKKERKWVSVFLPGVFFPGCCRKFETRKKYPQPEIRPPFFGRWSEKWPSSGNKAANSGNKPPQHFFLNKGKVHVKRSKLSVILVTWGKGPRTNRKMDYNTKTHKSIFTFSNFLLFINGTILPHHTCTCISPYSMLTIYFPVPWLSYQLSEFVLLVKKSLNL